jgi:hypothetical protein
MADQWYFGRDADITGPLSGRQLAELAAGGGILRTDTVWKNEVETGVPASDVRHLFPVAVAEAAPEPPAKAPAPPPPKPRKGRAIAGKGALIVAQDGTTVKYRKKCTGCGYEDSCWHSQTIKTGTIRQPFFCPKCRRRRDVEIQCYLN